MQLNRKKNENMGGRPRRHTGGQGAHEKIFNITNYHRELCINYIHTSGVVDKKLRMHLLEKGFSN